MKTSTFCTAVMAAGAASVSAAPAAPSSSTRWTYRGSASGVVPPPTIREHMKAVAMPTSLVGDAYSALGSMLDKIDVGPTPTEIVGALASLRDEINSSPTPTNAIAAASRIMENIGPLESLLNGALKSQAPVVSPVPTTLVTSVSANDKAKYPIPYPSRTKDHGHEVEKRQLVPSGIVPASVDDIKDTLTSLLAKPFSSLMAALQTRTSSATSQTTDWDSLYHGGPTFTKPTPVAKSVPTTWVSLPESGPTHTTPLPVVKSVPTTWVSLPESGPTHTTPLPVAKSVPTTWVSLPESGPTHTTPLPVAHSQPTELVEYMRVATPIPTPK